MASNNMYRVGDFVYFESSATAPYQVRRIDELNKTSTGAVEAKVACYFRRRDVSIALINQAEKYYINDNESDDDSIEDAAEKPVSNGSSVKLGNSTSPVTTEMDKHRIKHRELFLSRQIECLPATHIRGKCSVTLYNDAEPLTNYLKREDAFYYKLIYDPSLKTLQEDRGAMRIGSDHQSDIQHLLQESDADIRRSANLEELVWQPDRLTNKEVDMFCLLARAVGTLGRAYESSSATKQPLLLGAVAAASRDVTRQYAHDILHKAEYDIRKAIGLLLPDGHPVVCRDQLEEWSASEAHIFEEALDKYSKVFPEILSDYLPWKTHKSLVELYYSWKTTDRYVRQRRTKLAAQEHKLKQVYIPNYSKPNPTVLYSGTDKPGRGCEGCAVTSSTQWYAWGPQNLLYRLCSSCWTYWKRYGGLKNPMPKGPAASSVRPCPDKRAQGKTSSAERVPVRAPPGSANPTDDDDRKSTPSTTSADETAEPIAAAPPPLPSSVPICPAPSQPTTEVTPRHSDGAILAGGPRGTQCFKTPSLIRLARILCPDLLCPTRLARRPGKLASTSVPTDNGGVESTDAVTTDHLSFHTLAATAQPVLSRISDPNVLLSRSRRFPPLDQVVRNVAALKGIQLQELDLGHVSNGCSQSNGPLSINPPAKRPHSPSPPRESPMETNENVNGNTPTVAAADIVPATVDLCNGASKPSKVIQDQDSPPPCKKQAGGCSPLTETTNGFAVNDKLEDQ